MSPCERCDFIGPELPGAYRDARELHRAAHMLIAVFEGYIEPLTDWQMRVFERFMESPIRLPSIVKPRGKARW